MMNLIIPSLLISCFGLFNLFGIKPSFAFNQLLFLIISFGIFFFIRKIGRHFFQLNAKFFYWLFIFILIATFIIGFEVKGSRRWIDLYFFKFQASEFFKIVLILFLSEFLVQRKNIINSFSIYVKALLYFILPLFIFFKQPDLGDAMVLTFIFFAMILFSDFPKKYLIYTLLGTIFIIPLGWFFLKDYQRARLLSFFSPHIDTQGTAYNMIQAMITVGSGQFFGRGLGLGTQSRLLFLPENHTDFAFSSLVEQFGFFGGTIVILLYGFIIYKIAKRLVHFYFQKDEEGRKNFLFCAGILSYIVFQVFVNVGMNLGLLPVAGISLPFISYGGSSVLALMIGFALIP